MRVVRQRVASVLGLALVAVALAPSFASGQSINYRAQGHYYSAKQALERGQHVRALEYVYESRRALNGSNMELQYIHVLAAYRAGRYKEAQEALGLFFDLAERRRPAVHFDRSVDRLTTDEIRAVTMLINPVDEQVVAEERRQRQAAEEARRRAQAEREAAARAEQQRAQQLVRQRQELQQQIEWARSQSASYFNKGALKITGGGLGLLLGGLIAWSELSDENYGDPVWGYGALAVAVFSGFMLFDGIDDIDTSNSLDRRADQLARQLRALSVAPSYFPEQRSFGLAASIRF